MEEVRSILERIEHDDKKIKKLRAVIAKGKDLNKSVIDYLIAVLKYAIKHPEVDTEALYEDLYRFQLSLTQVNLETTDDEEDDPAEMPMSLSDEVASFFFELSTQAPPAELIERLQEIQGDEE
jgi:hypothetical protein